MVMQCRCLMIWRYNSWVTTKKLWLVWIWVIINNYSPLLGCCRIITVDVNCDSTTWYSSKTVTAEDDELFFDTLLIWEFEISWRPWHWLLMFRHTAFCWLTEAWAYKQSKLQKKICVHLAVLRLVGACSLLICWSLFSVQNGLFSSNLRLQTLLWISSTIPICWVPSVAI